MHPILFHLPQWLPGGLGGMPIFSYGVMMVIGFFAALALAKFLARRNGIDPEIFVNAGLIALVTGVIGARLSHVLENYPQYFDAHRTFWQNFSDAADIRSGGLTFYGGFLLALPCTLVYGLYKKLPLRLGMDIAAPCLMIGLGFGRIGCFLNGCCYGAQCNVPWGNDYPYFSNAYIEQVENGQIVPPPQLTVHLPDGQPLLNHYGRPILVQPVDLAANPALVDLAARQHSLRVHPAQLYSTLTAWLIAALLVAYFTIYRVPGRVFALMLLVEAPSRFILEMLRVEPPVIGRGTPYLTFLPPWSFSMVLSVILLIGGVVLWIAFGRLASAGPADRVAAIPRRALV